MRNIGILITAGAIAAVTTLSGCGSDKKDSAGSDHVTVTYMLPTSWVSVAGFQANVAAWEKKTGNEVKLTPVPDGNYDALVQARIAAKSGVDIFAGQDTLKDKASVMRPASGPWVDRLTPYARKAIATPDGKIYGTPTADSLSTFGVIYNKDVFGKAGVTKPPATLTEFSAALEKIKTSDATPLCLAGKDGFTLLQHRNAVNAGLIGTTPGMVADLDANKTKWGNLPGFTQDYQALADWVDKGLTNKDALTATYDGMNVKLAEGKCGAIINGTWAFQAITQVKKDANIGFFALPSADGKNTVALSRPNQLKVTTFSKVAAQAQDFLNFMIEQPQAQKFMDTNPGVSPFADVKAANTTGAVADFQKITEGNVVLPFDDASIVPQPQDDIVSAYQELIGKQIDVPKFTKRIQDAWQGAGSKAGIAGF